MMNSNTTRKHKLVLSPNTTFIHPDVNIIGELIVGEYSKIGKDVCIISGENTLLIGSNVIIEDNVKIEAFGKSGNTYICNQAKIKNGARICNAYIEENALINSGAIIMCDSFIGANAVIGQRTVIAPNTKVMDYQICEPNSLYAGIPARKVADLGLSGARIQDLFSTSNIHCAC